MENNTQSYCSMCLYHVHYIGDYSLCKVCGRTCCTDCVPTDRITLCSLRCTHKYFKENDSKTPDSSYASTTKEGKK